MAQTHVDQLHHHLDRLARHNAAAEARGHAEVDRRAAERAEAERVAKVVQDQREAQGGRQ